MNDLKFISVLNWKKNTHTNNEKTSVNFIMYVFLICHSFFLGQQKSLNV